MAFSGMREPAFGQALFVLAKHCIGVTHRSPHRHRTHAGKRTSEVLLHQTQRPTDTSTGWSLRIGAETSKAGIEAYLLRDRTIDDDDRKSAGRVGLHMFAVRQRV